MHRGEGPGVIHAAGASLGILICYEDLLSEYSARTVELGVQVLVNMTNDSWFGAAREQSEHLGLAVLRTVETRRALIRAVNAGISAAVLPSGKMTHSLPVTDADTHGFSAGDGTGFVADVPLVDPNELTLYVRIYRAIPYALWICILALAYWPNRSKRAQVQPPSAPADA